MRYRAAEVEAAVAVICPEIQIRLDGAAKDISGRALWWELSTCVLSSQVPYALATAAADALDHSGVLVDHGGHDRLEERIFGILSSPVAVNGRMRKYRFPAAKAAQLALTHQRINSESGGLARLLDGFEAAEDARQWFVENAAGLGPKQASMFLRNVGVSYDLAVLDRHVLQYMELVGLRMPCGRSVRSMSSYVATEFSLRDHAVGTKCPVGILDWAIWIVMRVIKQQEGKFA